MNVATTPDSCTIQLGEKLTFDHHVPFRAALKEALAAKGVIQLDCKSLNYLDSAGLGMLLLTKTEAEKQGRKVMLIHINSKVMALFQLVHFDKHFNLAESI